MFPFLTSYDPAGTSEGTLDPLGNNDTGSENTAIGNRDERLSKTS